jgi:hypothetical protein
MISCQPSSKLSAMRSRPFHRFSYFLDYLAVYGQSHKLLFLFEVDQLKLETTAQNRALGRKEATFAKYWAPESSLSLGLPMPVAELTSRLYEEHPASCLPFAIAQAFVAQELMERCGEVVCVSRWT